MGLSPQIPEPIQTFFQLAADPFEKTFRQPPHPRVHKSPPRPVLGPRSRGGGRGCALGKPGPWSAFGTEAKPSGRIGGVLFPRVPAFSFARCSAFFPSRKPKRSCPAFVVPRDATCCPRAPSDMVRLQGRPMCPRQGLILSRW